jgi:hypothetical protein
MLHFLIEAFKSFVVESAEMAFFNYVFLVLLIVRPSNKSVDHTKRVFAMSSEPFWVATIS